MRRRRVAAGGDPDWPSVSSIEREGSGARSGLQCPLGFKKRTIFTFAPDTRCLADRDERDRDAAGKRQKSEAAAMTRPIRTVLVANRGEIAMRVLRTVKAMGFRGAVVYHAADRDAPAVDEADIAIRI